MKVKEIIYRLEREKPRSVWGRGVNDYAIDILGDIEDEDYDIVGSQFDHKLLLNGANNWNHYSWAGCALCYDHDIAKALCTPSELKRTENGTKRPNREEEWLDVQARALYQAEMKIFSIAKA